MNILYTWIGTSDLRASEGNDRKGREGDSRPNRSAQTSTAGDNGKGPVADTLLHLSESLDRAVLLFDCSEDQARTGAHGSGYVSWLEQQLALVGKNLEIVRRLIVKGDPTSFNWAYDAMRKTVGECEHRQDVEKRYYLVGPGTPTMAACTLIVARLAACAGTLWQADVRSKHGCRPLELPFDLNLKDAPDPAARDARRAPGVPRATQRAQDEPIVESPSTQRAWALAERAAQSRWPVLILGNTGTGKEVLVKHLLEHSRLKGKVVSKNCGAIPENLIEAELFGYKKGAFTGALADQAGAFEQAGDGIVFLDEIGELPLHAQARFLRVLQENKITRLGEHTERELTCRIVAATHRNLWQAVQAGDFRADLYYRLAGLIITLDDLVERPEDLGAMIDYFWQQTVTENPGFPGRELSEDARRQLLAHSWPGNVRELRATLVRTAFLAKAPHVAATDVVFALVKPGDEARKAEPNGPRPAASSQPALALPAASPVLDLKGSIKRYQLELVQQALGQAAGNKSRAARALGISVQHLGRLLKDSSRPNPPNRQE